MTTQNKRSFPLIGIGASAGGIMPLKQFFANVSADSGLAYIVVVHKSPDHPTSIDKILERITDAPVSIAEEGETIKESHVYVLPSGQALNLNQGKFDYVNNSRKEHISIDAVFASLAAARKIMCGGIILSGSGNDGTQGVQKIKQAEGIVLVQDPKTAEYSGMPGNVIDTGLADKVCIPEEMPGVLENHFKEIGKLQKKQEEESELIGDEELRQIFSLILDKTGHDFSQYKQNTLHRRILRRMMMNNIEHIENYIRLMQEKPKETETLFREFLIGVTSFFRDPDSFERLRELLKDFIGSMDKSETVRIWVPACSTGEEAYSVAIILREIMEKLEKLLPIQVFATDIDRNAIQKARGGIYSSGIARDVGKKRLKRFFIEEENNYRIKKEIRDSVFFSGHDLLKDPPFSQIHLITCRNIFIYLNSQEQKRLLRLFHYTLKPMGLLMLGSSESITDQTELFSILDNKWKIFQKKNTPASVRGRIGISAEPGKIQQVDIKYKRNDQKSQKADYAYLLKELLLDYYCPAGLLTDTDGNIIQVQGRLGKYLDLVSEPGNQKILDIAREGLQLELPSTMRQAISSGKLVVRQDVAVKTNGSTQNIDLRVMPLQYPESLQGLLFIVFQDICRVHEDTGENNDSIADYYYGSRIRELEKELNQTREIQQVTMEELESANEELKSTNEELQLSNEELQSINEELESFKEELQALNEESDTVNSELQSKVSELSAANDDLRNLLNSTDIAVIFVDNKCRIRRYNDAAAEIVNLIRSDEGRPLGHLVHNLNYDHLIVDIETVLEKLDPLKKEVAAKDGTWYFMKITPYKTAENKIDGAVITFYNINDQKKTQEFLEEFTRDKEIQREIIRTVFDMNWQPLLVLDSSGKVLIANSAFSDFIGDGKGEPEKTNFFDQNEDVFTSRLKDELRQVINREGGFTLGPYEFERKERSTRYTIKGRVLPQGPQKMYRVLLQILLDQEA
ncbi:MAG: CheR family methyltransferase [Spirochaetia bacterium]